MWKHLFCYRRCFNISKESVSNIANVDYFCTPFIPLFLYVYFRTIVLISLFSQYLTKIKIPVPAYSKERGRVYVGRFPLFRLFPVSTCIECSVCNLIGLYFV